MAKDPGQQSTNKGIADNVYDYNKKLISKNTPPTSVPPSKGKTKTDNGGSGDGSGDVSGGGGGSGGIVINPQKYSLPYGEKRVEKGREEDSDYTEAIKKTSEAATEAIEGEQKRLLDLSTGYDTWSKTWKEIQQDTAVRWGDLAKPIYKEFQSVSEELSRARAQLANMKIDPDRVVNGMNTFQKVIFAIGAGIDGFAAGYNKTKPTLVPMLEKAIERDIRIQQQSFKNKMDQVQLTATERNRMWNMFSDAQKNKESALWRVAQFALSDVARKTKMMESRVLLAKSVKEIGIKQAEALHKEKVASMPKVTKVGGSRTVLGKPTVMMPKGGGGDENPMKGVSAAAQDKFRQLMTVSDDLETLSDMYMKTKPTRGGQVWTDSDTNRYYASVARWLESHAAYITGAAFSTAQEARFRELAPKGKTPFPLFGEDYKRGVKKIFDQKAAMFKAKAAFVRMYPSMFGKLSEDDKIPVALLVTNKKAEFEKWVNTQVKMAIEGK